MLEPGFNVASIAAKRRNKSNPWFQARDAIPERRGRDAAAGAPMTAREIADALISGKRLRPEATRKQAIDLQAAIILAALRKRNGGAVVGDGAPARWRLSGSSDPV
jgi:hypothetical protein